VAELARGLRFDEGVPLGARISDYSNAHRLEYNGGLARDYEVEMRQEIEVSRRNAIGRGLAPTRDWALEKWEGDPIHG
jgi:hypothetical protein